jgi:hypothetical protein
MRLMRRKTFDTLVSGVGLLMAAVLIAAGALLTWGYSFIDSQVHDQLASQKIFFPASDSKSVQGDQFAAMRVYGGQQLTTGAQAETYANDFIAVHLSEVAGGKTYSQVSALAQADPTNPVLQAQVNTLFKGNTLRGLLLNGYAFWKMGQLALIAAFVSFGAAIAILILSLLGLRHARRISPEVEILTTGLREPVTV